MHTFTTIFEARRAAAEFREDYNYVRPHSALGMLTPREFAERNQNNPPSQFIRGLNCLTRHAHQFRIMVPVGVRRLAFHPASPRPGTSPF
jgi:Integrase core domain